MSPRLVGLLVILGFVSGVSVLGMDRSGGGDLARIFLNQIGFHPEGEKRALAIGAEREPFRVVDESGRVVFEGMLGAASFWPYSGQHMRCADFSAVTKSGRYRLKLKSGTTSHPFRIAEDIFRPVLTAAIKAYYFNRSGTAVSTALGGAWARAAGHPDTRVVVHASAAEPHRPAGTVLASSGGWYDAGDYNKYTVNSAFAMAVLLLALERDPHFYADLEVAIPERDNELPDLLDEVLYNLDWLLTMQDPTDGGVYHKLSVTHFEGVVMPRDAVKTRYLFAKNTGAALTFAAVTALASRVLASYPGEATRVRRCRAAARAAWRWARTHPDRPFVQPEGVITGPYIYDHEDFRDEWAWAAAELFLAEGDRAYLDAVSWSETDGGVPSWDYVAPLAWLSLAFAEEVPSELAALAASRLLASGERLRDQAHHSAARVAMGAYACRFEEGAGEADFSWGSNGMAGAQGMVLMAALRLTGDPSFREAALANLDYLLGRNSLDLCFVTGFGTRSPRQIHHRPSQADDVEAPVPGFLVGGPHAGRQDLVHCPVPYPSALPALAYLDHECSYATNEVTINWNATFIFLAGALEADHRMGL
ncbi:Endoglucanase [Sulfidibacter corallicola]|uniref:Endoglucanase n=1 Tax=Sulfidibacter corallicola TaxID=2818388 RepID=A0A8A4TS41_SULCO|nr:glycoside hydrolase family 9 protein [Sulfidibacter corallicola]QTD51841.1 glycoside hydrolase family 9 protein [Sulfidibacter corallicola]